MQSNELRSRPDIALNTDTGFLKLLAIVLMVIDHIGYQFMGNDIVLRTIGRLSYPLFAWCVVVQRIYA